MFNLSSKITDQWSISCSLSRTQVLSMFLFHCFLGFRVLQWIICICLGDRRREGEKLQMSFYRASQVALVVKILPANAWDIRNGGSVPGLERSPGEGNDNPLQCSCLGNPLDRGAQRVQHDWAEAYIFYRSGLQVIHFMVTHIGHWPKFNYLTARSLRNLVYKQFHLKKKVCISQD